MNLSLLIHREGLRKTKKRSSKKLDLYMYRFILFYEAPASSNSSSPTRWYSAKTAS